MTLNKLSQQILSVANKLDELQVEMLNVLEEEWKYYNENNLLVKEDTDPVQEFSTSRIMEQFREAYNIISKAEPLLQDAHSNSVDRELDEKERARYSELSTRCKLVYVKFREVYFP